ncbi:hypothetical protein BS47DRAFT_698332 [Hydnum rufescens UP504]|uniref:Uncharacterized protein n=1 Tax=Hydnum rufescens UP504 TaxID=1448309 RepID=A0A9P6B1Y0_9AGAM|nr:hypothetical protein BS47DRAFT_698332 [Hydnum rufescens UP504]
MKVLISLLLIAGLGFATHAYPSPGHPENHSSLNIPLYAISSDGYLLSPSSFAFSTCFIRCLFRFHSPLLPLQDCAQAQRSVPF